MDRQKVDIVDLNYYWRQRLLVQLLKESNLNDIRRSEFERFKEPRSLEKTDSTEL